MGVWAGLRRAIFTLAMDLMLLLKLLWLLSTCCGQHLPSPDGSCEPGFVCKSERHCARYLDLRERLHRLNGTAETDYYEMLEKQVKERVCNKAKNGVCCKENVELTNGNIVRNVEDIPFIARLT